MPFGPYPGWGGNVQDPFAPDVGTQEVPWWYGAYNWMQMLNDPAFWVPPDRMNQPAPGTWDNPQPQQPQQPSGTTPGQSLVPVEGQPEPTIADLPNVIDWSNLNVLWPWGWDDTKIGEQPPIDPATGQPVYKATTVGQPMGLAGQIGAAAGAALAGAAAAGAFGGGQAGTVYELPESPTFYAEGTFKPIEYDWSQQPTQLELDPFSNPEPPLQLNYDWAPQPTTLEPGNVPPEGKPPEGEPPKTPNIPKLPIPTGGGGGGGAPMPVGNFPVVGGGPELRSLFVPVSPEQIPILSLGQILAGGLPYAR